MKSVAPHQFADRMRVIVDRDHHAPIVQPCSESFRCSLHGSVAGPVEGPRCRPLCQRSLHRVAGRVLLVGDAAGYADAITGEGIAQGLAQARAAVAAMANEQPRRYEKRMAPAHPTP